MSEENNQIFNSLSLKKSNNFISSKYKTTVIENKIMAIALTRIEKNSNGNEDAPLEAKLYPNELKHLFGSPTNIYNTLKKVATTMPGHALMIEDGKGNFNSFSMVPNAKYYDGVFTVYFNNELRQHILGLKGNYTTLEVSVITSLKSNASIRIYELLKKEVYKSDPNVNGGMVSVEYNVNEFRFMIGLADIEEQEVKNAMARMGNKIDWDFLYEKVAKRKSYALFKELKRKILEPAKAELEEISNIRFEYQGIKTKGNKFGRIMFFIYPNTPQNKVEEIEKKKKILEKNHPYVDPEILFSNLFDEYLGHNYLQKEDLILLLEKAEYNEEEVRNAIKLADKQSRIDNYMGWLISCIEGKYEEPVAVMDGSKEKAEKIDEIMESYKKSSVKERVWEKTTQKEDFHTFLRDVGLTLEILEADYPDVGERVQLYTDWRLEKQSK